MIAKPFRNYLLTAILTAALLMGVRFGWQETIKIGCLPAGGTPPAGLWMDGCASDQIGSYGLDVLWYGPDPKTVAGIERAKVLIFGDSRMLTAMSEGVGSSWFSARMIPMYLLAFAAGEQSGFADRLVGKLRPRPVMAIFDTDPYFTGEQSIPAQAIANDPEGEEAIGRETKAFLDDGPVYCRYAGWLCGRTQHFYRRYLDGTVVHPDETRVWFNKNQNGDFPITPPGPQDRSHYDQYLANARSLLTKLNIDPHCAVFTIVPNSEMDDTLALYLADHLGARVVAPRIDGLATVDHYHLNQAGAEAWTKAFLNELEPVTKQCLAQATPRDLATAGH